MKKLLLIGINTRSMLNSALKLNYEVYSTSYFSTSDMPQIENQKIILKEEDNQSCGIFEEKFNKKDIINFAKEYIDEVDYIIPVSGISPNDFTKKDRKKILGNKDVSNIEDKFQFYKSIKNKFKTPETFKINDIDEAIEICKNKPHIKYIIKPIKGSGGYNIHIIDNESKIQLNDNEEYMLQEYVEGINLSSSILGTKNYKKNIMNSRLLNENDVKHNNKFTYIGNVLPLTKKSILSPINNINEINKKMVETSEKLAYEFDLIGSNGVDYILNENGLYVIEINPRIQGTFECVEKSLQINMLEAHIKACKNELITIPEAKYYSYKKIIYSPTRMKYKSTDLNNIYDLPHIGSITEKSEPLLTVIDSDKDFEKLCEKIKHSDKIINTSIKYQQDAI